MPNELIKFEDFAFSPAEGLRDHAYSPTEPENEEAKKLLALSKRGLEEYKKEQSKMYRGMFDRF